MSSQPDKKDATTDKLAIKLKIAGKSYSFTISREKEELYRHAEKEVNAYLTRFEKAQYKGFSTTDCLALASLQLSIANLTMAQSREVGDDDLKALTSLDGELNDYLQALKM